LSVEENKFLEDLVIEMNNLLFKYARLRVSDEQSAYDTVQETYLAAKSNIKSLMESANPQGWLMKALKYKILHEKRAKAKFIDIVQKITLSGIVIDSRDDNSGHELRDILSKKEYELLRLKYIEGYTTHEIAESLGITYEACKKRIQHAKRNLLKELV